MNLAGKNRGIFIVIDGIDGTGKTDQAELLKVRLKTEGFETAVYSFPRYDAGTPAVKEIKAYLAGDPKYQNWFPLEIAKLYACDRLDAKPEMTRDLEEGKIIISNRYVSANMGHQAGKGSTNAAKLHIMRQIYDHEFGELELIKPDLTLILHLPVDVARGRKLKQLKQKNREADIHERDENHLLNAHTAYLIMCLEFLHFKLIPCVKGGRELSRQEIHELIWSIVKRKLPKRSWE